MTDFIQLLKAAMSLCTYHCKIKSQWELVHKFPVTNKCSYLCIKGCSLLLHAVHLEKDIDEVLRHIMVLLQQEYWAVEWPSHLHPVKHKVNLSTHMMTYIKCQHNDTDHKTWIAQPGA